MYDVSPKTTSISSRAEREILGANIFPATQKPTMEMEIESKNLELKHLGFVRMAVIHTIVCVTNLYDYAKQNSGPLRSTVETVEGAVNTVVGPACEKLRTVPDDVLLFFDNKVDKATDEFDKRAPPLAKQGVNLVQHFVQKAARSSKELVNEFQRGGLRAAVHYAATEYKQLVLNQGVKIWTGLNRLPPFHKLADLAVPSVARWLERYNDKVKDMRHKGYHVFGYFPEVPVSEIAKAFRQGEARKKEESPPAASAQAPAEQKSDSDSDSD